MANGTDELPTPEQIEDLAATSAAALPTYPAPAAPPNTQFVSGAQPAQPPVPVLPMGTPRTFTATSPPTPPPTPRDTMEQMRQSVNAMKFKNANDAYRAAVSFQATRAYQRDIESGKTPAEALSRWGYLMAPGQMGGWAAMTRATQPAFTPTVTNMPGLGPVVRSGRYGERVQFPPASMTQPGFKPQTMIVDGERVIQLGPNRWQYLGKEVPTEKLPAGVKASIWKQIIADADKQLEALPGPESPRFTPEIKKQRDAIDAKRKEAMSAREAMVKPQATNTPNTKRVRVREKATGKTGYWEGGPVPAEYETISE